MRPDARKALFAMRASSASVQAFVGSAGAQSGAAEASKINSPLTKGLLGRRRHVREAIGALLLQRTVLN
jgi:hypothetical protein